MTKAQQPELKEGEKYIGAIISADGSRNHHIILLPGEFKGNWKASNEWAASIGGELPDRVEGALLFSTIKDEFEPTWYWLREQPVSDSDFAWDQSFVDGSQNYDLTFIQFRARAVRRLVIE